MARLIEALDSSTLWLCKCKTALCSCKLPDCVNYRSGDYPKLWSCKLADIRRREPCYRCRRSAVLSSCPALARSGSTRLSSHTLTHPAEVTRRVRRSPAARRYSSASVIRPVKRGYVVDALCQSPWVLLSGFISVHKPFDKLSQSLR